MGLRLHFSESSSAWLHHKILPTPVYFIGMESAEVVEQNDSSNDANESDSNAIRNELSSASIYGKGLEPPVLGSFYRAPDIPKKYIEPIVLDTSLPYVSMPLSITWHSMVCGGSIQIWMQLRLLYLCRQMVLLRNTFMTNLFPDSYLHASENS